MFLELWTGKGVCEDVSYNLVSAALTGAPYREVNSKVGTAPNTQSRR